MRLTNHPFTRSVSLIALLATALLFAACADEPEPYEEAEPLGQNEMAETEIGEETYFTSWDADNDTYLTEEEWDSGFEQLTFWDDWDADGDMYLNEQEFEDNFGTYDWYDAGYWQSWDANQDAMLDQDEFRTGLYDTWDTNQDAMLDQNEYDSTVFE